VVAIGMMRTEYIVCFQDMLSQFVVLKFKSNPTLGVILVNLEVLGMAA
jgi:hypothetical protein